MVARQGDVHLDASLGYLDDSVRANASDLCLRHNTQLVADALVKAGKDFDLLILPNARHGFGQDSFYMMRRRWDYFVQHLQGAVQKPGVRYATAVGNRTRHIR